MYQLKYRSIVWWYLPGAIYTYELQLLVLSSATPLPGNLGANSRKLPLPVLYHSYEYLLLIWVSFSIGKFMHNTSKIVKNVLVLTYRHIRCCTVLPSQLPVRTRTHDEYDRLLRTVVCCRALALRNSSRRATRHLYFTAYSSMCTRLLS